MKKTMYFFAIALSALFIHYSCEYSPPEIPFTEIKKPSENVPGIWIELKPEMDTLKLAFPENVSYTVDTEDRDLYQIEFYLDDEKMVNVDNTSQNSASVRIPVDTMFDGLHHLKIRTYTSTNSGSIADKLKAEQFVYEINWPVLIDKSEKADISNCKISKIESTPDGLVIWWRKYIYADFKNYRLTRHSSITYGNTELVNTTDANQYTVLDKDYVEGAYFSYSFWMFANGFSFDTRNYFENIKPPKVKINSDRSFDINWSPSKYPQNVKSYYLKTSIPKYGYPEEKEILDLSQTTIRFNEKIGFGGNYGIQLRYIPKGYEGYKNFDVAGGLTQIGLGDSIPSFQRGFLIDGTKLMLIYIDGKFYKYNYLTRESSSSISITPIESVYQRLIISSASGSLFGYLEDRQFVVRKSSDWSLVRKMDIEAYDGFNLNLKNISLSDNGLIVSVDNSNMLRIFNFYSGTKILNKKFGINFFLQNAVCSPNGKMVCVRYSNYSESTATLISYKIEGSELKETGINTRSGADYESSYVFSPFADEIIYFNYQGMYRYKVDILDSQTLAVKQSVQIPFLYVPIAFDFSTNRVIAQYQSFPVQKFSLMYDVITGKQSFVVQFVSNEQILFSNGNVYSGNGRSIKIDDYIIQ